MKRVKNYYNEYKSKYGIYLHYKDIYETNITRRIFDINNEPLRNIKVKRIKKEKLKLHLYLTGDTYTL